MSSDKQGILSDKELLGVFWKLGSSSSNEREKGSIELLHMVIDGEKDHNKSTLKCDPAAATASRLQYSLERLHKGLMGFKPEAKLGFSLALTMLLEKLNKRKIRAAFDTAQSCLLDSKPETKQERSSKKSGLCFLLLALTRSSGFPKLRSAQKATLLHQVAQLIDDSTTADLASMALAGAVDQLATEEISPCLFEQLSEKLACGWDALDINRMLLLLRCHRLHKETIGRAFLKSHYATKHLISEEHFEKYKRICLGSVEGRETLSCARLHPGVEELLTCLVTKSTQLLASFIGSTLSSVVASTDVPASRKSVAFNMLGWVATDCPVELLPPSERAACLSQCLSDPDVCRQIRVHAGSASSALHGFARHLLGARILPEGVDSNVLEAVATRLLGADCLFDSGLPADCRILRSDLLARLPVELLDQCAQKIEQAIPLTDAAEEVEPSGSSSGRQSLAFACQTLRLLAVSRQMLRARPKSAARSLLRLAERAAATGGGGGDSDEAAAAFSRALDSLASASSSSGAVGSGYRRCLKELAVELVKKLGGQFPASTRRCLERGLELLEAAGSTATQGVNWCFALAYFHLGFHLLLLPSNDNQADARELIADLDECQRRSVVGGCHSNGEDEDGKPKWPDVLLDSFLGLLGGQAGHRSRMLRSVAALVARQLAALVTPQGVTALAQSLLEGEGGAKEEEEPGSEDDSGGSESEGEGEGERGDAKDSEGESESEISIDDGSSVNSGDVNPAFRRACKSALGDAACPSDIDADPSDLSDSAMERVDEALSLAFRSNLGPRQRRSGGGGASAVIERRRRSCQARLRLLDIAEALLEGGAGAGGSGGLSPQCRAALAACLGRLALLSAGVGAAAAAGQVGGFWTGAPAAEREQLRVRSLELLKKAAGPGDAGSAKDSIDGDSDHGEICATADAALAANLRSPLPAKVAQTAADTMSALLRVMPTAVESRLADSLCGQLSPQQQLQQQQHRPRIGGLALWRRVAAERPRLVRRLRARLLELLLIPGGGDLRSYDAAALIDLAACLFRADADGDNNVEDNASFERLSEWTFARLGEQLDSVTSAKLLAALLGLAAELLKRKSQGKEQETQVEQLVASLATRMRSQLTGCKNRDLRRALHVCLTALEARGGAKSPGGKAAKRLANQEKRQQRKLLMKQLAEQKEKEDEAKPDVPQKKVKKLRKTVAVPNGESKMELD